MPIWSLPRSGRRSRRVAAAILCSFGVGQQVLARAPPFLGQQRVAAHHQPFPGIVRGRDLAKVTLVEQRRLESPGFHQILECRGAQRRNPVETGRVQLVADAGFGDHAAVADQDHPAQPKPLLQLDDLRSQGLGIGGVALEHLDRHRTALPRAQKAIDDLHLAALAVPVMAEVRQFALPSLQVAGGHVVKNQRPGGQMFLRQRLLDPLLLTAQPVQRLVQFVLVNRLQTQYWPQGTGRGLGGQSHRRRQLGRGLDDPGYDQGQAQPVSARPAIIEPGVQTTAP